MYKKIELQIDYHQVLFPYIIKKYNIDIEVEKNKETDDIVRFFTATFEHLTGTANIEALRFIELLQQRIEEQLKKSYLLRVFIIGFIYIGELHQ